MRILHLSSLYPPHLVGGAERVVEMLAEGQVREGHDVSVAYIVPEAQPEGERHGVKTFPIANSNLYWIDDVPFKSGPLRMINKAITTFNFRSASDFGKIVRKVKPDVVHSHSMVTFSPLAWQRAKDQGVRLVHTLHDYDMVCLRATLFNNGRNCVTRRAACEYASRWKATYASLFDAVVGVSEAVLAEHVTRGALAGVSPDRLSVIWNGARVTRHDATAERAARQGPFTFGFIGRLVPEKGLDVLLAACRLLPAEGWKLRIAGKAPGENDYEERARGLPIEFCGFVDSSAFMDTLDVLVVPSVWREPFGLTVVESLARGVPVLGTAHGAVCELVTKSGLGSDWVVQADDPAALAQRMSEIMARGRQALPSAETFGGLLDQVSPEKMVGSYLGLYEGLLSDRIAAE